MHANLALTALWRIVNVNATSALTLQWSRCSLCPGRAHAQEPSWQRARRRCPSCVRGCLRCPLGLSLAY